MASLKDVAEASGVSIRTVSRTLKQNGYVGEETRKRVMEAAERLGYRPNLAARSLKTGKSYEIGAVLGSTDTLHMGKVAAFEKTLRDAGYRVHIVFSNNPEKGFEDMKSPLDSLLFQHPAAVAVFPGFRQPVDEYVGKIGQLKIPLALVDKYHAAADRIVIDREAGVEEAVKHLYRTGRRNIAYFGSGGEDSRVGGYDRAIAELGLEPHPFKNSGGFNEYDAAAEMVERLLKEFPQCDSLQVYTDVMAMGVLREFSRRGVKVPEDIALVGFDDRPFAKLSCPSLTTVAQPNDQAGQATAEVLLSRINGEADAGQIIRTLPTKLVVRESA